MYVHHVLMCRYRIIFIHLFSYRFAVVHSFITCPISVFQQDTLDGGLPDAVIAELKKEDWYHGPVSTNNVSSMLRQHAIDGDYLIRPIVSKVSIR